VTRWQYCEVWWHQPECAMCVIGREIENFPTEDWPDVFAQLGVDGWELVSTMNNPTNEAECWFYFKRPLDS